PDPALRGQRLYHRRSASHDVRGVALTRVRGSTMQPHERIPYSAITERPRLTLPGGARLAVCVVVNVEEWTPREPMPRTVLPPPAGSSAIPDIPNWAWHEYGNRV